jgi:hypothetical protein
VCNNNVPGQHHASLAVFKALHLTKKDINKLFVVFNDIDADGR